MSIILRSQMEKKVTIRHIKIQLRFIEHGRYRYQRPEIRLCGKWLDDLGFSYGKIIIIRCENNKLVIITNAKDKLESK